MLNATRGRRMLIGAYLGACLLVVMLPQHASQELEACAR